MDPPERTNCGSVVWFAIELEVATAAFYTTAAGLVGPGRYRELARALAAHPVELLPAELTPRRKGRVAQPRDGAAVVPAPGARADHRPLETSHRANSRMAPTTASRCSAVSSG